MNKKLAFIMQAEYENGESRKIAIIHTTWNGATDKAKQLLGEPEKYKYKLHHGQCGEYLEYTSDEI